MGTIEFKRITFISLIFTAFILLGCNKQPPVPDDKKEFIGVWQSPSGFQIEIMPEGYANIYQPMDSLHPEFDVLGIKKANAVYNFGFGLEFTGDSIISIKKLYHTGRQYTIDVNPYFDADTMKMVMNGVVLRKYNEDHFMAEM